MGHNRIYFFMPAAAILVPAIWFWSHQGAPHQNEEQKHFSGTSAWCSGNNNVDRVCRFKNLCYSSVHDKFLFVHGNESILEGIPRNRFEPALVDLSSVADHNTQYFHYVDVGVESLDAIPHREYHYKRGKYLLFNRFNPSNMMHVFHDDLLPILFTLLRDDLLEGDDSLVTLLPFEGWVEGDFLNLYQMFSKEKPILKGDIHEESLVCFEETYVGLSKLPTWYQYGFHVPQGPLPNLNVTSYHIKKFRDHFKRKLNLSRKCPNDEFLHGVILSREENRLIVNEAELAITVSHVFNIKMLTLSLESQNILDIINAISCAKLLVGVHGSLLILSMFLPPSSSLVEIFPYGINPDHYTPYKTLVSLPGMGIEYVSWRNLQLENTITHPEYEPEYGGISHLERADQEVILESAEVPLHLCCQDPHWLFRVYQDTVVDVTSIVEILTKVMVKASHSFTMEHYSWIDDSAKHFLAPGFISNLKCSILVSGSEEVSHSVSWTKPLNIDLFEKNPTVQYEVWVQGQETEIIKKYVVDSPYFKIDVSDGAGSYFVWIRTLAMGTEGPRSWIKC